MYCSSCGVEMVTAHRFCPQCGAPAPGTQPTSNGGPKPRLSRSMADKKIGGVCSGIARYLGIDTTLTRIIFLLLLFYPPGVGLLLYIACWIVMPRDEWTPHAVAVNTDTVRNAG